ncbi:transcription factor Jun-like [Corticium candelabrum]|uniref:transcription factor Jun-like n=1 Tax=Corticium candelabrum TaxID=121492 RepID=UPI002E2642D7|nr:transcription factor Jun-like [Corticium candelabrum]
MSLYCDDIADTMNSTDKRRLFLPLGDDEEDPNQECPSQDPTICAARGKSKLAHGAGLSTPDTANLALTSPELEGIIISGSHTFLVSNGPGLTPSACGLNGNSDIEQQMRYCQEFLEALQPRSTEVSSVCDGKSLQSISAGNTATSAQRHSSESTVMSGEGNVAYNFNDNFQDESDSGEDEITGQSTSTSTGLQSSWVTWKATPTSQGNPRSLKWDKRNPPKFDSATVATMSPQERASYRAARKRARNRQAASRCREKKLKRQSELEDVVQSLTDQNTSLHTQVYALREEVCRLKDEIVKHAQSGCRTIILESSLLTVQRIQHETNNY